MMGIGLGEMILIAGIALVVIGPEKFPDFAKLFLRTMRDLRGYVNDIQTEVSKELKPVQRELESISRYKPEDYIDAMTGSSSSSDDKDETAPDADEDSDSAQEHAAPDAEQEYDDSYGTGQPDPEKTGQDQAAPGEYGAEAAEEDGAGDPVEDEVDAFPEGDSGTKFELPDRLDG